MTVLNHAVRPRLVVHAFRGGSTGPAAMSALADHSAKAAQLFQNARMPAAFMASVLMTLTFALKLPNAKNEAADRRFALLNTLIGTFSLLSEIYVIVQSSVSVNKLTETFTTPSESVLALLQRDYKLAWLGTNGTRARHGGALTCIRPAAGWHGPRVHRPHILTNIFRAHSSLATLPSADRQSTSWPASLAPRR